jgi:DNA-binding beta-propeller fold protein YncE
VRAGGVVMGMGRALALAALLAVMVSGGMAARADAFVYWSQRNAVGRANLDGSDAAQSLIAPVGYPQGVAVDGQYVYWANAWSDSIGRANIDGTGIDQAFLSPATAGVPRRGWRSMAGPTRRPARLAARASTVRTSIRTS